MKTKLLLTTCFNSLLFMLLSCGISKHGYGLKKVEKDTDTTTLKQTIANIKGIPNEIFEAGSFLGNADVEIKYRLLKPYQTVSDKQKVPLVIVFHGSGAIGNENKKQLGVLAKLWALPAIQAKYPAYIVAPQFPARSSSYVMDSSRGILVSVPHSFIQTSLQLIDSLKQTLPVDEKRIYAMGFSMGGSSVINALSARPDLFAAGVSISGVPQFENAKALYLIPLWLLHGSQDTENPFESDKQFFKEVNTRRKTRFWVFENTAHDDIITTLLLGEAIPKWLFFHKKS